MKIERRQNGYWSCTDKKKQRVPLLLPAHSISKSQMRKAMIRHPRAWRTLVSIRHGSGWDRSESFTPSPRQLAESHLRRRRRTPAPQIFRGPFRHGGQVCSGLGLSPSQLGESQSRRRRRTLASFASSTPRRGRKPRRRSSVVHANCKRQLVVWVPVCCVMIFLKVNDISGLTIRSHLHDFTWSHERRRPAGSPQNPQVGGPAV